MTCGPSPAATWPSPGDPLGDSLTGGTGNDKFHTHDGEVDRITCGDGKDRVIADIHDVITDATPQNPNGSCERVTRTVVESDSSEKQLESPAEDRKES